MRKGIATLGFSLASMHVIKVRCRQKTIYAGPNKNLVKTRLKRRIKLLA